jgi:Tfp pilus assembly protein PilF
MVRLIARVVAWLALALLLSSCSSDPNKRKLNYLKSGQHYFNQNKFQEAVIEFRNAVQIDPRFAEAHYQLARSYQSLKNYNAAYGELLETVTLAPGNLEAQLQLAALLIVNRQFDQAAAVANKVLVADPKNPKVHTILGSMYAMNGSPSKAI